VPAGAGVQIAAPGELLYRPGSQGNAAVIADPGTKLPAGASVQATWPAVDENWPGGQAICIDDNGCGTKNPGAASVHAVRSGVGENAPAGQGWQPVDVVNVPAGHDTYAKEIATEICPPAATRIDVGPGDAGGSTHLIVESVMLVMLHGDNPTRTCVVTGDGPKFEPDRVNVPPPITVDVAGVRFAICGAW
jgi:hypothetical protein